MLDGARCHSYKKDGNALAVETVVALD
jgi:hypothetical protein